MNKTFEKMGDFLYQDKNHYIYKIAFNVISPFVKKWSKNRDPDPIRIQEMYEYVQKGGYIPKILYIAEIDKELICYDGNHRREVFTRQLQQGGRVDFFIIDIMFDSTTEQVMEAFHSINNSVPLPLLYLEEDVYSIKEKITTLVKKYEEMYKPFLSSSSRCKRPNFNRDGLVDDLYFIYQSMQEQVSIEELEDLLQRLNQEYSIQKYCRPHNVYNENIIKKCQKYGCWLFLEKNIPVEHLRDLKNSIGN